MEAVTALSTSRPARFWTCIETSGSRPVRRALFIRGARIGDRYRYDAVCRLEVRTVAAAPRTVRADRFTVERVNRLSERFSVRADRLRHARFSRFDDDGPHLLTFTTYLDLHSDRQPEVFRLGCSHLQASDRNPRHLTADEIRTTLAPIMTLYWAAGPTAALPPASK